MQWQCPSVCLSVRLSVRLSPETHTQKRFFSKTKQKPMVYDDQWEVLHGLFKEPILGLLR